MRVPVIRAESMDEAARVFDCIDALCDSCESNTKCNDCCIEEIRCAVFPMPDEDDEKYKDEKETFCKKFIENGLTKEEASMVFDDEEMRSFVEKKENEYGVNICIYSSLAEFGRDSFDYHNSGALEGNPNSSDELTDLEAECAAEYEIECMENSGIALVKIFEGTGRVIFAE